MSSLTSGSKSLAAAHLVLGDVNEAGVELIAEHHADRWRDADIEARDLKSNALIARDVRDRSNGC